MTLTIQKSLIDQDLIAGCIREDPKSQRRLYEIFSGKMFSLCLRYLKDEKDAEDVLISGFVKVFKCLKQYKGEGSLEGWIRTIMVNESLGFIRKHKNMFPEVNIEDTNQHDCMTAPENSLAMEDLFNLIQQLPTGYRTIFNLYAVEGYSHKEIAIKMGISVQTSKSQLSRARALLKRSLTDSASVLNEKPVSQ